MRRLSLIDKSGAERLLLKNPADYKSGFWTSYTLDGRIYITESTESKVLHLANHESSKGFLEVVLDHTPNDHDSPVIKYRIKVWSHNRPFALIRFTGTNLTNEEIRDMRIYSFIDFDIGGPKSYKDDIGRFNKTDMRMYLYDDSDLTVAIDSLPKPDLWSVSSPTKLKLSEETRDLDGIEQLGPKDVAVGLQWNIGTIEVGESKSIDLVITAAESPESIKEQLDSGWKIFDEKIQ